MATQILGKVAYTSRGAYDSSFSYEINDVVTYNGSSYVSLKETKGNLPTNENYWMLLAQKGDTYEVTEDDLNNIANQITEEANSSFNQNVDSKTKEFNTNASNKIDDFNSNASSKTETFNTNAVEKTTLFNENATTKLSEYNTNHDTKLETYNTNADERLQEFNDNANSYNERITINAEDIDDNTLRIKRLETDIFDSGEASGNSINIKDSTLAEFQEIAIDGVCEQVTTTGSNKLNFNVTQDVSYVTYNEDGTITINGNGGFNLRFEPITLLAGQTYYQKIELVSGSISGITNSGCGIMDIAQEGFINLNEFTQIDITEDLTRNFLWCHSSAVFTNAKLKIWLNTDESDFEPFTGGQASPRPEWKQPISVIDKAFNVKSVGKNRFNEAEVTEKTFILEDGTTNKNNNWISYLKPIKVIPNEKYTFSRDENEVDVFQCIIAEYNKNGQIIKYNNYYVSGGVYKYTMTTQANTDYVYLGYRSDFLHTDLQFEIGDKRTNFESYQETSLTIILPDGEFAGKIDETDKDNFKITFNENDKKYHLYLEKKIRKVILDGSQNVTYFGVHADHNLFQSINLTDANYNQPAKIISKCDKYISVPNNRVNGMLNFQLRIRHTDAIICWNDDRFDNADDMKKDLQNKPMTLYYVLAEPYTIDLGSVDMLLSYYPVTNVFTDSELNPNINAKYYREFVATIRNLQVNNGTLQSELADVQTRLSALETSLNNLLVSQVSESEVVE